MYFGAYLSLKIQLRIYYYLVNWEEISFEGKFETFQFTKKIETGYTYIQAMFPRLANNNKVIPH